MISLHNKTSYGKWMAALSLSVCFLHVGTMLTSCTEWSDHYEDAPLQGHGQTVMQLLEQNPQTTSFAQLVRQAGYADLLSSSQSFTVFAPTNSALTAASSSDATSLKRLVSNHIARQTHPSSTPTSTGVQMLNGKIYYFGTNTFANQAISDANEKADNGLVHQLQAEIPYANNIYEHIETNPATSKLYEFIHSFDEVKFDDENSIEIDIDDQGRPVYDTIMVNYNRLLEDKVYGLGAIAAEDSTYLMVLPTNAAWDAAYERIAPSFKVYHADPAVADSLQDIRTKQAIVADLIYRQAAYTGQDSLLSTTGSVIHSPSALLAGTTELAASNGSVYLAPVLNYDNTETWNKTLSVEAEQQNGRTYNNTLTSVYTRTVTAGSLIEGVSEDSYIEVMPISTSTNPTVIFDIPDVLAGTYNVYAVFLPATVEGATEELDSTRVTFTITYQNANGRSGSKNNKAKTLVTNSKQMTKMLAFEALEIPVSNTTDRLWLMDERNDASDVVCTTQLSIATNVTAKEFSSKELSRTFRLDRIILEPIKN